MRYRSFDGLCSIFWEAVRKLVRAALQFARPTYHVVFDDISAHAEMADTEAELAHAPRPMLRALYLPAGVSIVTVFARRIASPIWICICTPIGRWDCSAPPGHAAATEALRQTVALQDVAALEPLGEAADRELGQPHITTLFSETLVASMVAGLLDLAPKPRPSGSASKTPLAQTTFPRAQGRLTPAQMRAITAPRGCGRRAAVDPR